jgi:hypothetical protein
MLIDGALKHHGERRGTERAADLLRRTGADAGMWYFAPIQTDVGAGMTGIVTAPSPRPRTTSVTTSHHSGVLEVASANGTVAAGSSRSASMRCCAGALNAARSILTALRRALRPRRLTCCATRC